MKTTPRREIIANGYPLQRPRHHTIWIRHNKGFTLLEILVTIVISAVLAVILVQVMRNQPGLSFQAIDTYHDSLSLKSAMENITADYRNLMATLHPTPLIQLQDNLDGIDGFSGYWDPGKSISATHYCLTLEKEAAEVTLTETNKNSGCTIDDIILKIKLDNGKQSLTALFAR